MLAIYALFLAGATLAQDLSGLSQSCQSAASSLVTGEFATCTNLLGLVSLATTSGSLVEPLNNWISGLCSADPCSQSTLQNASSTLQAGCSSDIQQGQTLAEGANLLVTQYANTRELLCLQYVSNSSFCVPFLLESAQNGHSESQTLSLSDIVSFLNGSGLSFFNNLPTSAYCNDCFKASVIKAEAIAASQTATTSVSSGSVSSAAASACGSSFGDGQFPSTVRDAGEQANASSSGLSSSSTSFNIPLVGLAAAGIAAIGGSFFILL